MKTFAASELGDTTLLPHELPLSRIDEIANVFGDEFTRQVAQLELGHWAGPVRSSYGWHLVYVSERRAESSRPLAEVRGAVQREWMTARREEILNATYSKLREKYEVVVETPRSQADARPQSDRVADAVQRR